MDLFESLEIEELEERLEFANCKCVAVCSDVNNVEPEVDGITGAG